MAIQIGCPDVESLRRLMLGLATADEAQSLGEHLLHCAQCANTVHSLDATDLLVQAARAGAGAARHPDQGHIAALIHRLQQFPAPSAAEAPPTEGAAGGDTPSESDPLHDWTALLAPPQDSSEIGRLGPYRVLRVLGAGGMGVVFEAEDVQLDRLVALKVIQPGMDSRQVIARFEAERQALAMMDHPNIAKVLDAGTTESGRPYFVMELVQGVPITKYCDESRLSCRQRLELMIPVCQAIQHAHQKGIIHRDIKPSNVLVTLYDGQPVPKVIDFGLAKATAQTLSERSMFTQFGQIVGTLEYMSPEQAELGQLDIDTRSDIYSLGALLYELLTGSTPFNNLKLRSAAFDEMLRIIREDEPPKPSTRLSTTDTLPSIAANRGTEPARLAKTVRGELDWIVMKALEKDRNRRYETANGLAMDIERYLHDEPVLACPPSAAYRFRKFVRRNKRALGTAVALGVMLLVAVGAVALYGVQQGRLAKQRKALADDQTQFADEQVLAVRRLEGIQRETEADLYRALLGQADALRNAREPGYRQKVWSNFHEALALDVPGKDLQQIRDQVLACLEDPLGLNPIQEPRIERRAPHQIPANVQALIKRTVNAVSSDGQRVAQITTVDQESLVSLQAGDGKTLASAKLPLGTLHALAFSPDGQLLIGACEEGAAIWEVPSMSLTTLLRGPDLHSVAVDPGGRLMATRSRLQGVEVWSLASNRQVAGLQAPEGTTAIEFSANGEFLLARQGTKVLVAWPVTSTPEKQHLAGHFGGVTAMSFSPDGRKLASVAKDKTLRIWAVESGSLLHATQSHEVPIQTVAFSADGRWLATGDNSGGIRIWDPESGRQLAQFACPPEAQGPNRLRFDPGGKYLVVAGTELAAWAINSDAEALTLELFLRVRPPTRLWDLAIHPSGDNWVFAAGDGEVFQYNLKENNGLRSLGIKCPPKPFFSLCLSPDGHSLTYVTSQQQVGTWETGGLSKNSERRFAGTPKLAVSPDHRWAAILSPATRVVILDLRADRELLTLPEEKNEIWSLDWSPDGNRLAFGLSDGGLVIWNLDGVRRQLAEFGIALPTTAVQGSAAITGNGLSTAAFQQIVAHHRARLEPMNLLKSGQDLLAKQDYGGAITAFREAIRLDPNLAMPHFGLGNSLRAKGDLDGAIAAYNTAAELDPNATLAHDNLGRLLLDKKDFAGAVTASRRYVEHFPKHSSAHNNLGVALHAQEDFDGAVSAYRNAIELKHPQTSVFYSLGKALLHERDDAQRTEIAPYRKALELYPQNSFAHSVLGDALLAKRDLDGALAAYREAIRLDPNLAMPHYGLGNALWAKGDLDGAIVTYREAMRLNPKSAYGHHGLGNVLRAKGDLDGAIAAYRTAAELDPKAMLAHGNLGRLLLDKKDFVGAVTASRRYVEHFPKHSSAHNNLGVALHAQEDFDGAVSAYRNAIELKHPQTSVFYSLGKALLHERDDAQRTEIAPYRKALELYPQNSFAHSVLGDALLAKRDLDGALAAYREAIRLDPNLAMPHFGLGNALRAKGDLDGAIAEYRKASEIEPRSAARHSSLGILLCQRGEFSGGSSSFRRAVELSPEAAYYWYLLSQANLAVGDRQAFRQVCTDMLSRFGKTKDPTVATYIVQACMFTPDALPDMAQLMPLAELAVMQNRNPLFQGAAQYRAGKYEAAIETLSKRDTAAITTPWARLFLAMAHQRLGQTEKARSYLEPATSLIKNASYPWPASLHSDLLVREVEALIEGEGKDSPESKK